jgi:hypothetical protein
MNRQPFTVRAFLESLRDGKYAWPGGYPKYWLCSDGETLSYEACRSECGRIARAIRDNDNGGWRVVACDVNWEDPAMYCAHTNERIESAYAEDHAEGKCDPADCCYCAADKPDADDNFSAWRNQYTD